MTAPQTQADSVTSPRKRQRVSGVHDGSDRSRFWRGLLGEDLAEEIVRDAHRDFELYGLDGPEAHDVAL